jgi:hypothetical protein
MDDQQRHAAGMKVRRQVLGLLQQAIHCGVPAAKTALAAVGEVLKDLGNG